MNAINYLLQSRYVQTSSRKKLLCGSFLSERPLSLRILGGRSRKFDCIANLIIVFFLCRVGISWAFLTKEFSEKILKRYFALGRKQAFQDVSAVEWTIDRRILHSSW